MWSTVVGLSRHFCGDRRGAAMLIFGLTLIPVLFGIGLSIDYGRALSAKTRMSQAIDAAALAAGSWPDLNEQQLEAKALEFIAANYPPGTQGLPGQIDIVKSGDKITINATGHVQTTFLKIAGIDTIDVSAYTEVALKQKKIELVMVLDNTGSMSWNNKIASLKAAAKKLVDIMKSDADSSVNSDAVKIGLVPFAAAVNIGADKLNSGWIDVNALSAIASEDFKTGVNVLNLYSQIHNRSWNGCVRAREAPYDTSDAPPGGDPKTLWAPYFAPDEPDIGSYANNYASDSGFKGGYWDYEARQRYTGKYNSLTVSNRSGGGPEFNCEMPELTPLTQVKSDIVSAIDAMTASGSTVIPAGLAWGWRVASPGDPFTEGAAYDDKKVIKAIVLLTDGQNDIGGGLSNHNHSFYSAYGYAQEGHLGAKNGRQAEDVLDSKTATLCGNIKGQGIRLYTITFQVPDQSIKNLMRSCATEPAMYYDSPSNNQLDAIFAEIAKGLNELRLAK